MKPHLPITLLTALFGAVVAQAVEIPDGYEQIDLYVPSYLDDYTSNSSTDKNAFILWSDVSITPTTNRTWTSATPLINGGNHIFTKAEEATPSLSFSNGQSQVFRDFSSLTFDSIAKLTLDSNNSTYTVKDTTAGGGAVRGNSIIINNTNASITQNAANSTVTSGSYQVSAYSEGGAFRLGTANISNNQDIIFDGNTSHAYSSSTYTTTQSYITSYKGRNHAYSYGGAIDADSIDICSNNAVTLTNNNARATFGAGAKAESYAYGGSVYAQSCNFSNNGIVEFENNYVESIGRSYLGTANAVSQGGAIYGNDVTISNNCDVSFKNNYAYATDRDSDYDGSDARGGAIYAQKLTICGNESVVFEGNYEKDDSGTRNRSVYVESTITLAAKTGGTITFYDSIYGGSSASFNNAYVDANGQTQQGLGDIIFSGSKSNINNINGTITLYGGSLQVLDGAQLNGTGLTVAEGSGAKLVLSGAGMNHSGYNFTFNGETALELQGSNTITASKVTLGSGAELSVMLSNSNKTTAALTLGGSDLATSKLTINFDREGALTSGSFKIITQSSSSDFTTSSAWTAANVTVTVNGDACLGSFSDLQWKNGTLYYNVGRTIWSNASGDTLWNGDSDNWTMNGRSYAYLDGMDVSFTDVGAGEVQLVGDISPSSIIVENSTGNDYTFIAAEGGGKLTGSTGITKNGTGALTLTTANEHTGATVLNAGRLNVHDSTALGNTDQGGTATVTTKTGTTLEIGNRSHVVLAGANSIAGNVEITEGSTLELQNSGYNAANSHVDGSLKFVGSSAGTTKGGILSGAGMLEVDNSIVTFSSMQDYTGGFTVTGAGASLKIKSGDITTDKTIAVNGAGATLDMSSGNVTVKKNGVLSISSDGAAAILASNKLAIAYGATLSVKGLSGSSATYTDVESFTLLAVSDGYDPTLAFNTTCCGIIRDAMLSLAQCSTLEVDNGHLSLDGGELTLAVFSYSNQKIELILSPNAGYTANSQVMLFSEVSTVAFLFDNLTATDEYGILYTLNASDYFSGDWINDGTMLVYDSANQVVYLENVNNVTGDNVVPEPATATLSLLALAALAARRRRRE